MLSIVIMDNQANMSRKEQVIKTAASLFRKKGYVSASMRDLAYALGIEAASLYSHIKSKEWILQTLCFGMAEQFRASLKEVELSQKSFAEKLRKGITGHINVMSKDWETSAVFLNEHRHLSQPNLRDFLLLRINYINRFKKIIQNGIDNGEFRNVDTKLAVMTLFSSLNWMPYWFTSTETNDATEVGNQLANMLIGGIKK